jgi:membrane protein required for colicin V production
MNFIDLLILVPLLLAAWKGFKRGFIIEIFIVLALLVGIYCGIHFSDYTSDLIKDKLNVSSIYLPLISFALTFTVIAVGIYFIGKMLEKVVKIAQLSLLNKLGGVFFSVVKTLYFMSTLFLLIASVQEKTEIIPTATLNESLLYTPVSKLSLATIPYLKESKLFITENLKSTAYTEKEVMRAKEIADSLGISTTDSLELRRIYFNYEKN